jgi:uncharacterized coiled-coil protein SlyX
MTKKLIVPICSDHLDKLIEQRRIDTERIAKLEADLAKYQACRVHDVDEKAWLSKMVTAQQSDIDQLTMRVALLASGEVK